ncbi:MAG TPA: sulfatase [Niabella sp.]|nr:sulfatase [Niabella sp.]
MVKYLFGIACLIVLQTGTVIEVRAQKAARPNIVFILADDLGWSDLSCYGNRFNESPNIDQLAGNGIKFTNAYSPAPVCTPGRAGIMTGQYPARLGVFEFIPGHWRPYEKVTVPVNKTQYLPLEKTTLAEVLKKAGYETAYFGKWHLGDQPKYNPLQQGFDVFHSGNVAAGNGNNSNIKLSSDVIGDLAAEFIDSHKKNPFFIFLSYYEVHVPYNPKQGLISKYMKKDKVDDYPCNALYAASIEQMDQSIGRIVSKLKAEKLLDNTMIVFISDNGGSISENKYPEVKDGKYPLLHPSKRNLYPKNSPLQFIGTTNTPLRNEKGSVYEGGIRVPMIISWPAKISKGICKEPVIGIDLLPTLADVTGTGLAANDMVDGVSLLPLLENKKISRDYIFWHYPVYHHDVPAAAVRNKEWKLVMNLADSTFNLYNLRVDLSETTDLSAAFPEKLFELQEALIKWQKIVQAPMPSRNPQFNEGKRWIWGKHPHRN